MDVDGTAERDALFLQNKERLATMAWRAVHRFGKDPREIICVCVDVDDQTWTWFADMLMPGHDWAADRVRGEQLVARGTQMREPIARIMAKIVPDFASLMQSQPRPDGTVQALICAAGGVSLFVILPRPEPN